MTAKKNTQKSPVDLAEEYVKEVEENISALVAELEPLQAELDALDEKGLLTPADLDRLADLREALIPRRKERLSELRQTALPTAVANLRREELLKLAVDGVDGIEGKRQAMEQTIAEAEQTIAREFERIREAVEEWNRFVRPVLADAKSAGQDAANPVDPAHPITVRLSSVTPTGRPEAVFVAGKEYLPASAGVAVERAAVRADKHLAKLIHLGVEEATMSEVRRGRWS